MGSEITYAEVNFKNGPPPVQPKAPSENKKPPAAFQKLPPWVPWVAAGILLLLSIVLLVVIFVFLWGSSNQMRAKWQIQNATDWHCLLKRPGGKEQQLSCCMPGWVQNGSGCYYFSQNRDTANWIDSRQKCTAMGSDLVVINSEAEQDFLKRYAESLTDNDRGYWIGLTDESKLNKWQWVDKTLLNNNSMFWRDKEPTNGDEDCVVMNTLKGKYTYTKNNWNDIRCAGLSHRICETMSLIFY